MPALQLRGLSKRYGQVQALADVSLTVGRGRFLVLLGPSGSGKSTLVRCLAGIERPSGGEILISGERVACARRHVPPEERDLAMVFQDFALWPHMSVQENVAFALRRRRVRGAAARRRALEMLDRVGLAGYGARYPHELSGGEQQRVALARALVGEPALLLFDEPLSSLDANLRERLRTEIGTLVREQGATAVYITHDQQEAFALGDEIGILHRGSLVQRGTPEQIYDTPATPFAARFTGLAGALSGRVLRGDGNSVEVAVASEAPTRHALLGARAMQEGLAPGAAVTLMLSPAAVCLCEAGAPGATLSAGVRERAYQGRGYDYVLALGERLELCGVFDHRRFERGDRVGLRLDPSRTLAFAEEAATRSPALGAAALAAASGPGEHARDSRTARFRA